MENLAVKRIDVIELTDDPRFGDIVVSYAEEARSAEVPVQNPSIALYREMGLSGSLRLVAAYADEGLVGFIALLISMSPHYSRVFGVIESFFVLPAYRSFGTGQRLLWEAEAIARECGCAGMVATAPKGGRLALAFRGFGYKQTHEIHARSL